MGISAHGVRTCTLVPRCGAALRHGVGLLLAVVAASLLARAAVAAGEAGAGPDELYWLAPAVVDELAPETRTRLVAVARDVVAGRTAVSGIDAAVARALAGSMRVSDADATWLARYAAW